MENAAIDRATPTTVNSSVRTREYLTARDRAVTSWFSIFGPPSCLQVYKSLLVDL